MNCTSSAGERDTGEVTAILFDADGVDRAIEPLDDFASVPDKQVYWLILAGPSPFRDRLATCGMAIPSAADTAVLVGDGHFSFTVAAAPNDGGHSNGPMTFIVGQNWLITLSDRTLELTRQYLAADAGKTLKGRLTGTALAVSLMMAHFDEFHGQLSAIGRAIDRIDDQVFRRREQHDPLTQLAVLRRRTARLRELVSCHRRTIATLDRPDFGPEVCPEDRRHLGHLDEAYHRLVDTVDRTREAVLASFDLYATRVAQDTNRLLERLTLVTIGIGAMGVIAGIMVMNFKLAIFEKGPVPFSITVGAMGLIAAVTLLLATAGRRTR